MSLVARPSAVALVRVIGATAIRFFRAVAPETPSVLFYPRALRHRLVVPGAGAADVLCATVRFPGGAQNPLARSLPDLLLVPLDSVATLAATLDVLYQEAGADAYGRQVILDRL